MLRVIKRNNYDRSILIGRPKLTLKNIKCQNITCGKSDSFKHFKEKGYYICECGYIIKGEVEIQETHKIKFYCKSTPCIDGKTKMDSQCLKCEFIGER